MLKFHNCDIVFSEIPDEVTLAINLTGCPYRCDGCHSPWLWEDTGEVLNEDSLTTLLGQYGAGITCVCFMGGDSRPEAVARLAEFVKRKNTRLKTGWYSGREELPEDFPVAAFDFIKLGGYVKQLGGLTSPATNQRFYRIDNNRMTEITNLFHQQFNKKLL